MQPHELAIALAELSVAAGTPRRVAIISEAQAEEIRERGDRAQTILAMRQAAASRWPLELYKRGLGNCDPVHVIWLEANGYVPHIGACASRPPGAA